jgi:hypothetical protein
MPPIDWLHLAAVALGAVGTFFLQGRVGGAGGALPALTGLLDGLLKTLESRLSPGPPAPGGKTTPNPLMTIRVLLVPESAEPK